MRAFTCVILLLTWGVAVDAQIRPSEHKWEASIKVVDESGIPVQAAQVRIGYSAASANGEPVPESIVGLTDTNGIWTAEHVDRSVQLDFSAQKVGYYSFSSQHFLGFSVKGNADWNPSPTLILKRIRNPIPMYARPISRFMPTNGQSIGFDLINGDWIAPYGRGKSSDIVFTVQLNKRSNRDYDYSLAVSFPNKGDGIQGFPFPYPIGQGSALRSPHEAPDTGYEAQLVKSHSARPGKPVIHLWNERTNYLVRVQTAVDEQGEVKSALYGKIYGDFNRFHYYLNPTPNDRNIEFAPGKNLFKNLKQTEAITQP